MNNHIPCNQIRCSKSKNKLIKIVKNSCHICLQKNTQFHFCYIMHFTKFICFVLIWFHVTHTHTHKKHLIFARWRTHRQSAKIIKLQFDDETVQHTNVYTHSRSIMRLWTYARAARLVAINLGIYDECSAITILTHHHRCRRHRSRKCCCLPDRPTRFDYQIDVHLVICSQRLVVVSVC